jgi:hypothetical protein
LNAAAVQLGCDRTQACRPDSPAVTVWTDCAILTDTSSRISQPSGNFLLRNQRNEF